MAILLTGATGYLGAYLAMELLQQTRAQLILLVRAAGPEPARARLWQAWRTHISLEAFNQLLDTRADILCGDLTLEALGLPAEAYGQLVRRVDSIVHCAAAVHRRSERLCLQVNLKGTLETLLLARAAHSDHGLERYTFISSASVASPRAHACVQEDQAIDWGGEDVDPYSRTKKFGEHLVRSLLPDASTLILRPALIVGDSRGRAGSQVYSLRLFQFMLKWPLLPVHPAWRIDTVPADFVAQATVALHAQGSETHGLYHLSAGAGASTCRQLAGTAGGRRLFLPALAPLLNRFAGFASRLPGSWQLAQLGRLIQVFFPFLTSDMVYDNQRIVAHMERKPAALHTYLQDALSNL